MYSISKIMHLVTFEIELYILITRTAERRGEAQVQMLKWRLNSVMLEFLEFLRPWGKLLHNPLSAALLITVCIWKVSCVQIRNAYRHCRYPQCPQLYLTDTLNVPWVLCQCTLFIVFKYA